MNRERQGGVWQALMRRMVAAALTAALASLAFVAAALMHSLVTHHTVTSQEWKAGLSFLLTITPVAILGGWILLVLDFANRQQRTVRRAARSAPAVNQTLTPHRHRLARFLDVEPAQLGRDSRESRMRFWASRLIFSWTGPKSPGVIRHFLKRVRVAVAKGRRR